MMDVRFGREIKIECPYCHKGIMFYDGTIEKVGKWATTHLVCGECNNGLYVTAGKSKDGKRFQNELDSLVNRVYATDGEA